MDPGRRTRSRCATGRTCGAAPPRWCSAQGTRAGARGGAAGACCSSAGPARRCGPDTAPLRRERRHQLLRKGKRRKGKMKWPPPAAQPSQPPADPQPSSSSPSWPAPPPSCLLAVTTYMYPSREVSSQKKKDSDVLRVGGSSSCPFHSSKLAPRKNCSLRTHPQPTLKKTTCEFERKS